MKANQARMDANTKTMQENLAKADAHQAKMEALTEMTARMQANMGSMKAELKSAIEDMKIIGEETMAGHETMEARLQGEPASVDRTPEVAQEREAPREDAVNMPVGEPRKRRWDRRKLAAVRRQKEQDQKLDANRRRREQRRAQRKDGCRRNLVAARRGTTRRVQVARRSLSSTKDTTRDYCGSRKDLGTTGREETRRAKETRRKQNFVGSNRHKEIATGRNHPRTRSSE
jgi:hypothetical protein